VFWKCWPPCCIAIDWPIKFKEFVNQHLPKLQYALNSNADFRQQQKYLLEKWNSSAECLIAGLYAFHVERWTKAFNESQLIIVDGEEMMKNPGPIFTKLQDFIGVPHKIREEDWVRHNLTGHFCLRRPQNRRSLICQGSREGKARTRTKYAPKPDHKVMKMLRDFYEPYNTALYRILRHDYGW